MNYPAAELRGIYLSSRPPLADRDLVVKMLKLVQHDTITPKQSFEEFFRLNPKRELRLVNMEVIYY
jgi:hypothetical protein